MFCGVAGSARAAVEPEAAPGLRGPSAEPVAAPAASEGLDEAEAVDLALRTNPALRAFRAQRAVAEGEIVSASALSNPSLRLEMLHVQEGAQMGWGSTLKWAPPQPGVWPAQRAQARANLESVRSEIATQEWALATQVRTAHATLLELREQARLCDSALALRRRVVALLRTRVGRGGATRIELNLAELAVLNAQREADALELRRTQAQAQLQALLGVASVTPVPVRGVSDEQGADAGLPDPEALAEHALSLHPALKAARARIGAREQAARTEHAKRWPWLELSGRYRQNASARYMHDVQLAVELTLPILNLNTGPIRVTEAALDQEKLAAEARLQALRQGIYAACAELRVHKQILRRFRDELLPILSEHERLMEIAARGAEVDLIALLSSEESVLRGRREYSDARLAYRRAWLGLEGAAGVPLQEVRR